MSVQGFWGLQVEPENSYTQVIDASFRVTMAALGEVLHGDGRSVVKVVVDSKEFVLCSLCPDKREQQSLDHTFVEGEEVTFMATGKNTVHLTGNYVPDQEEDEDEMEIPPELAALAARMQAGQEIDADEDVDGMTGATVQSNELTKLLNPGVDVLDSDEDDDDYESGDSDDDGEEDDEDEDDEQDDEVAAEANDVEEEDEDEEEEDDDEDEDEEMITAVLNGEDSDESDDASEGESEEEESEEEIDEKALAKEILAKNKRSPMEASDVPVAKKQKAEVSAKPATNSVRNLSNGMIIEELKAGKGEKAKAGKRVSMRYIGKLQNGKVFDKNVSGSPFTFSLGRGEVIKGWDIGVAGLQVGGERKLTIPAALAYGKRGSPPVIPPNATLIFTVKLLAIK
ncbi:hypothetical protein INT43_000233 [Umbelopsis isabellina]|uniref:FK506-binding protein n=1 Tax=Mortierella isabellina TaxID=91625 RepID=A0A8H7UAK6_MORIS|nr:hypothetical protein INT43_000233 [Umbelopsis isabellina]